MSDYEQDFADLPRAYNKPVHSARFRQLPEHFQVDEELDFKPCGHGDHLYLKIRKTNTNTHWLMEQLAGKTGLSRVDIGYAGRKDRFAVTSQWFSLHLPGHKTINLSDFQTDEYQVIEQIRHTHKLRTGELRGNHFKLQLVDFEGDYSDFQKRTEIIARDGFPNYFGPQRFGHNFSNIDKARNMLAGKSRVRDRNKRSIYLSAARSFLFNLVLAKRIELGIWQKPVAGDRFWDHSENRLTDTLEQNDELLSRLKQGELSITGPMFGDGESHVSDAALELENESLATESDLCKGIANSRVKWQRRPLRSVPENLSCSNNQQGVEITFFLNSGSYATSLLRELLMPG